VRRRAENSVHDAYRIFRGSEPAAAYSDHMRRSSPLAVEISTALASVSARRLEGWSLDGLGADEGLSFGEQVAHYRQLGGLAGPGRGRSADVAARRLAAHGFVCRRLRGALLRGLNIADVGEPEVLIDFSSEESSDAAFDQLDQIARAMNGSIGELPLPMRHVVEKLRRNVYDAAAGMGESGDVVYRAAIVNFLCPLFGGEIYDAQPIAAMFGVDPSTVEPDAVDFINRQFRITAWEIDETYRSASLDRVVVMARWLRERADLAVSFLGLDAASESQLDELAAIVAPYALLILSMAVSRFDDAGQFVADLELPAALTVPELSAPPLSA
jgi:hypothetical protein